MCDLTYDSFIFVMQKTLFRLSYMTHTFDDFTFTFLPMLCPLSSDSTAVVRCLLHQCVPLHNKENPTFLLWHLVYSRKCSRHKVYPYSELSLCFFCTGYSFWDRLLSCFHRFTWIILSVRKLNKLGKFW